MTTLHRILSKSKDHPARRAMLADFVLGAGETTTPDHVIGKRHRNSGCAITRKAGAIHA